MREKPLEIEYCQISTKVPLCSQKDFSSSPNLPYSCSSKRPLLALPGHQQRHWSRIHVDSPVLAEPLWDSLSQPPVDMPHSRLTYHPPWLVGMWCPVPWDLWHLSVWCNHQQAAKCQSFIPAHRGLQTSQLDSKRKAKPGHDSTERVCWTHSLFSSPGLSWTLDLRNKGAVFEQTAHWQQLWR